MVLATRRHDHAAAHARPQRPGDVRYPRGVPDAVSAARIGAEDAPDRLLTAELLSIGTELTAGETRDTNAGEIARSLTVLGVRVGRIQALPDDLSTVGRALGDGLDRAGLVVCTGGLGPTPDDLTREAIAEVCGEQPIVDPALEAWLRELWARRGMPFPKLNLKQAWLISSATPIPNDNGTAPGWWVDRPDGRLIVALPGPPREMRPMWDGWVLPRLAERGLGREVEIRTLRLFGIGESQAAERLGDAFLRTANPIVATYARQDAVDVRIAAVPDRERGQTAADVAAEAEAAVVERLGEHVWARGATTWQEAIATELGRLGWRLATVETGTGGSLAALLSGLPHLARAEILGATDLDPGALASVARQAAGVDAAVAVRAAERGGDTAVSVAVATADDVHRERRVAFLGGVQGGHRAGLAAADVLLRWLRRRQV